MLGLMGTILGMTKAFDTLGKSGVGDPAELSTAIGETLISFTAGVVCAVIGAVLLLFSLVFFLRSHKTIATSPAATLGPGSESIG
jgi:biopolymer transport protein ExbB/TolQ